MVLLLEWYLQCTSSVCHGGWCLMWGSSVCHNSLDHCCEVLYLAGYFDCEVIHTLANLDKGVRQCCQIGVVLLFHFGELSVYLIKAVIHVLFHLV